MLIEKLDNNIIYYKNVLADPKAFVDKIEYLESFNDNTLQLSKWKTWKASDQDTEYGVSKDGMFSNMQYKNELDLQTSTLVYNIKSISDLCFVNYAYNTGVRQLKLPDYFSIRKYNSVRAEAWPRGKPCDRGNHGRTGRWTVGIIIRTLSAGQGGSPSADCKARRPSKRSGGISSTGCDYCARPPFALERLRSSRRPSRRTMARYHG